MMKTVFLLLLVAATLANVYPVPGKKVLAVLEDMSFKQTHSQFFSNLKGICSLALLTRVDHGCELTFVTADDSFEIIKYGESTYDHVILMVNSDKKHDSLSPKTFRSFLDFHGDIFVMFSGDPSNFVRSISGYAGVEIDPKGSSVVDHFTAVPEASNIHHTKFQTTNYLKVSSSWSLVDS